MPNPQHPPSQNAGAFPRFILIEPSHAGNVGATARAMKTMGFDDLVLVRPRWANVLRREETIQRASGALDVLQNCRIVERFEDACDGIHTLLATAMTPRDFGPPTLTPRAAFEHLATQPDTGKVGFVFGNERFGMKNEDVYQCHTCLQIPTNPQFGSLNLASAVQLIAYEWRMALGGWEQNNDKQALTPTPQPPADVAQIQAMLAHWGEALTHIGFLDPAAPRKLIPKLQQTANRARLSEADIHILRGIAKAVLQTNALK